MRGLSTVSADKGSSRAGRVWEIFTFVEQRLQLTKTRSGVPDVLVMPRTWKKVPIIEEAPLLCIEVLSPEDAFSRTQVRCRDYLTMASRKSGCSTPGSGVSSS